MEDFDDNGELAGAIRTAGDWLTTRALPYWCTVGVDGTRGFVEHLTLEAIPAEVDFKRTRVQARQIYVFSHAYLNGFAPGLDAAANGWAFIRNHAWSPDGNWARVLARNGTIRDATADLYDHASILFAIAWWIRASGEDAVGWAEQTIEAVERHLATPGEVGWWSENGPTASLVQNPHMHLLEGCLAAYGATGAAVFKSCAERIVSLFETRLFDRTTGTLAEHFDDEWRRRSGARGAVVEPGHHYEWVCLLISAARWIPSATRNVDALFNFAEHFGSAPETGLIYDEVYEDGSVATPSHRLWPNTEALKAHLARFDLSGIFDRARVRQLLTNLFTYYLGTPTPDTWIDQLNANRRPRVDKIPASALYHIHLAVAEAQGINLRTSLRESAPAARRPTTAQ